MAIEIGLINGMSVGIEYMPDDETDELIKRCLVVDLLIVRLAFVQFRD